jgi:hypothetical protein
MTLKQPPTRWVGNCAYSKHSVALVERICVSRAMRVGTFDEDGVVSGKGFGLVGA